MLPEEAPKEAERSIRDTVALPPHFHGYPSGHRTMRVLILDDEQGSADALCATVAGWGHEARIVNHAAAGLADAGARLPNVVLLDVAIPELDGYAFARQLRLNPRLKGCYVIAMRSSREQRRVLGMDGAIDLFLAKPINLGVLETLLRIEGERLDRLDGLA